MLDRTLIAMSSDIDEGVIVTGFVQSIEEDADAVPRRWRITILEAEDQQAAPVASRVSERMCKQVSVSLPKMGDSHDDQFDDYTGVA
jgi:hypothetical protein